VTSSNKIPGYTYHRGQPGYEAARQASLRNALLPERYPDVIVQANDAYDVVAAIRLARTKQLRVAVRSGGHSWAANHLRDGGLLLDVSRLNRVHIDANALRATAGPGCSGYDLVTRLGRYGLFFPAGHCKGVCLGGYLLQGGYGWHSRVLGPACMSVEALDLVTADGDVVRASADQNADLYWAARGAGPGFFGVVTRFHLRLYRRPKVIGFALQHYSIDMLDDVFRWAHAVGPEVPGAVELMLLMSRHVTWVRGPGIIVVAPVFAEGWREALAAVRFMNDSPLRRRAALRLPFVPSGLRLMYAGIMKHYPERHRYAVDNMWTGASIDALLPGLRRIAETLPPAPSHTLWMNWMPPPDRPDMAYSMEDNIYLALYSVWKDPKDDAECMAWPVQRMREMQVYATGCQLADENLGQRPARFASDDHLERLDCIRSVRDPEGRFHTWMGRPCVASPEPRTGGSQP
jgi:FAD/FMN-containing dehydrogenase